MKECEKIWAKQELLQFSAYFENICLQWLLSSDPAQIRAHSLIEANLSSPSSNAKSASFYWHKTPTFTPPLDNKIHETLNSKHIAGGDFCAERFHTTATLSCPVVVEIFGKYKTTPAPAGDVIKQRYKLYARVNGLITSRRIFIILQNCSLKYTRLFVTKIFLGPNINKTLLIAPNCAGKHLDFISGKIWKF